MFSRKEELHNPCPNCGEKPSWGLLKMIDSRGSERYPFYCNHCHKRTQCFEKKISVPQAIKDRQPDVIITPKLGICERCGKKTHLEEHHWAPWKYFKDANDWPKSSLCRKCHEEWHQIMTGDLRKNS